MDKEKLTNTLSENAVLVRILRNILAESEQIKG